MTASRSKTPAPRPAPRARSVDQFLADARATPVVKRGDAPGRLIFAIDATASRQPTWDLACELHAELFAEVQRVGNLAVQLVYFRGLSDFSASPWLVRAEELRERMLGVSCRGGRTQLVRLLGHAQREAALLPVRALIYIGDAFEESETSLLSAAGQLALRNLPALMFQEGRDAIAERAFAAVATITGGAHVRFDPSSPDALRRLLGAAATFATGGRAALERFAHRTGDAGARRLLTQIRR